MTQDCRSRSLSKIFDSSQRFLISNTMAAYDDLNVSRIFTVGIISVVVTAVTALAVQVMYYALAEWQAESKIAQSSYRRQQAVFAEQTEQISKYGVDPTTGNVTIPIDKAIELMVREESKSNGKKSETDET